MAKNSRFLRRELFYRNNFIVVCLVSNRKKVHRMEEKGEEGTIYNRHYAGPGGAGTS